MWQYNTRSGVCFSCDCKSSEHYKENFQGRSSVDVNSPYRQYFISVVLFWRLESGDKGDGRRIFRAKNFSVQIVQRPSSNSPPPWQGGSWAKRFIPRSASHTISDSRAPTVARWGSVYRISRVPSLVSQLSRRHSLQSRGFHTALLRSNGFDASGCQDIIERYRVAVDNQRCKVVMTGGVLLDNSSLSKHSVCDQNMGLSCRFCSRRLQKDFLSRKMIHSAPPR